MYKGNIQMFHIQGYYLNKNHRIGSLKIYSTHLSKPFTPQEFWSGLESAQDSERTDLEILQNQYFSDEGVSQQLATVIATFPGYDPVIKEIYEKPKWVGVVQTQTLLLQQKAEWSVLNQDQLLLIISFTWLLMEIVGKH